MDVMMLAEPGRFESAELPVPEFDGDRVVVDVEAVALCGSDLSAYRGTHPAIRPPTVIGHEFAGWVVEPGSATDRLSVGDLVCVDPTFGCGTCRLCRSGRANICRHYTVMGRTLDAPGAMAKVVAVPADHVYALPAGFTPEVAALIQPLSVGFHAAIDRGGVRPGDVVLVAGAGPIGAAIVMASSEAGAHVMVMDLMDSRLSLASEVGASVAVNPGRDDVAAVIADATEGYGVDVAFEAVGGGDGTVLRRLVDWTAPGGTVVVVGAKQESVSLPIRDLKYSEKTITGSQAHPETFPRVIAGIASGALPAERIISHRFPFSQVAQAFAMLDRGDHGVMKVVLRRDPVGRPGPL